MHHLLNWPKAWLLIASITALTCQAASQAACHDNIIPSTPTSRFTVHDNGTVTDTQTGLLWQRCSLGQSWNGNTCSGDAATYTWQAALSAVQNDEFAGVRDWVLPNIKQLTSIVELACVSPAINTTVFPNTPNGSFWTSSPDASGFSVAWSVSFYSGGGNNGFEGYGHVRLVRGGQ